MLPFCNLKKVWDYCITSMSKHFFLSNVEKVFFSFFKFRFSYARLIKMPKSCLFGQKANVAQNVAKMKCSEASFFVANDSQM